MSAISAWVLIVSFGSKPWYLVKPGCRRLSQIWNLRLYWFPKTMAVGDERPAMVSML